MVTPITEEELLATIRENPMICTRAIVKKLRPDEFRDQAMYREHLDLLKPMLEKLYKNGTIVSAKVQYCTFNLKQWQIARHRFLTSLRSYGVS